MEAGDLPNLARLRRDGAYRRLATTTPAQTPVAWSSFATGVNPGGHGIFDFLRHDPATYRPEAALYGFERPSRFLPARPVNRRRGTAVWETLGDAGVPSIVLRHPCTFPPTKSIRGRILAGVGVPDLRGSFGTSTVYTSSAGVAESSGAPESATAGRSADSEVVVPIRPVEGRVETHVEGPHGGDGHLKCDVVLQFDPERRRVRIESGGADDQVEVEEGGWSDWLRVRFRAGLLQTVRGRVRFHLVRAGEPHILYASPVNYDAEVPVHAISEPWDYAWELDRALDGYHTLGMAEDHAGLNNGRLSEEAFLVQCGDVRRERLAMMHYELERHDRGLFYCLFDTPDRVQHMFWRYREDDHPSNADFARDPAMARAIEDEYRACDDAVGQALAHTDDNTLFLVASDHGFTSFQRELHLNRWLHDHGYLALKEGAAPDSDAPSDGAGGETFGPGLDRVDWSRTRAYALGLVGIHLNLEGREGEGTVSTADAPGVAAAIRRDLAGLGDPERGVEAVRGVELRADVYQGPYTAEAPDLIVQCAPGYRVSSATALGGVPGSVFSDNRKRWSGDHVVHPAAVPGVLFSSRPIPSEGPRIIDLAPTILEALGVPVPEAYEGEGLLPAGEGLLP